MISIRLFSACGGQARRRLSLKVKGAVDRGGAEAGRRCRHLPLAVDDDAVDWAEDATGSSRDVRQADEPVREWPAAAASFELLLADRLPEFVDCSDRVGGDLVGWQLEVFCPETLPRPESELRCVGDDVHLAVVEERVLVEVGRADGQPV